MVRGERKSNVLNEKGLEFLFELCKGTRRVFISISMNSKVKKDLQSMKWRTEFLLNHRPIQALALNLAVKVASGLSVLKLCQCLEPSINIRSGESVVHITSTHPPPTPPPPLCPHYKALS